MEIDERRLTSNARRMIETLEFDLSDMLSENDLLPSLRVWEQHISIEQAALILGLPAERAVPVRKGYGGYCDAKIVTREHRLTGLHHYYDDPAAMCDALNRLADTPGLHVYRNRHDPEPVRIAPEWVHVDNDAAAEAWRHCLRSIL